MRHASVMKGALVYRLNPWMQALWRQTKAR
jgi:hypothetical protein